MIFVLVLAIGTWWGQHKLRQVLQQPPAQRNHERLTSVR